MSRGYDGPEIDDFRDSGAGRDRDGFYRDSNRGRDHDWPTRTSVRLKLQRFREVETDSDQLSAKNRGYSAGDRELQTRDEDDRAKYADRDRSYSLRPSEIRTLAEVGKFRIVSVEDLAKLNYAGDRMRMENDLRNLAAQGLMQRRGTSALKKDSRQILNLTKRGQRLIQQKGFVPDDQAIYSGLVKPKEAQHDSALYRLYHKAAEEIERKGGRVLRVQLDYELKERLYQRLGRAQARGRGEAQRLKDTFARDMNLPVVHGKVSFPDLRIEYETQGRETARVDLELATGHYHAGHLAEKAYAGFQIYARPEDTAGLRRVRDEREIMTSILSL